MKKSTHEKARRRAFLKGAAVAGAVLGVATTRALAEVSTEDHEAAEKPVAQKGYRETRHIREYYRLARF